MKILQAVRVRRKTKNFVYFFACIAIFIACLGLFGYQHLQYHNESKKSE